MAKIDRKIRLARWVSAGTMGAIAAALLGPAAHAYEVTISPSAPRLGDTVSVVVQAESAEGGETAPTVIANGVSYQSFSIGGDRFQSLIPTSPLDSPGQLTIRVSGAEAPRNLLLNLSDRTFRTQALLQRGLCRGLLPPGRRLCGGDWLSGGFSRSRLHTASGQRG